MSDNLISITYDDWLRMKEDEAKMLEWAEQWNHMQQFNLGDIIEVPPFKQTFIEMTIIAKPTYQVKRLEADND